MSSEVELILFRRWIRLSTSFTFPFDLRDNSDHQIDCTRNQLKLFGVHLTTFGSGAYLAFVLSRELHYIQPGPTSTSLVSFPIFLHGVALGAYTTVHIGDSIINPQI